MMGSGKLGGRESSSGGPSAASNLRSPYALAATLVALLGAALHFTSRSCDDLCKARRRLTELVNKSEAALTELESLVDEDARLARAACTDLSDDALLKLMLDVLAWCAPRSLRFRVHQVHSDQGDRQGWAPPPVMSAVFFD